MYGTAHALDWHWETSLLRCQEEKDEDNELWLLVPRSKLRSMRVSWPSPTRRGWGCVPTPQPPLRPAPSCPNTFSQVLRLRRTENLPAHAADPRSGRRWWADGVALARAPTGAVTLAAVALWQPGAVQHHVPGPHFARAAALYRRLLRALAYQCGGVEVGYSPTLREGTVAFVAAADAVQFAVRLQLELLNLPWPEALHDCAASALVPLPPGAPAAAPYLWRGLRARVALTLAPGVAPAPAPDYPVSEPLELVRQAPPGLVLCAPEVYQALLSRPDVQLGPDGFRLTSSALTDTVCVSARDELWVLSPEALALRQQTPEQEPSEMQEPPDPFAARLGEANEWWRGRLLAAHAAVAHFRRAVERLAGRGAGAAAGLSPRPGPGVPRPVTDRQIRQAWVQACLKERVVQPPPTGAGTGAAAGGPAEAEAAMRHWMGRAAEAAALNFTDDAQQDAQLLLDSAVGLSECSQRPLPSPLPPSPLPPPTPCPMAPHAGHRSTDPQPEHRAISSPLTYGTCGTLHHRHRGLTAWNRSAAAATATKRTPMRRSTVGPTTRPPGLPTPSHSPTSDLDVSDAPRSGSDPNSSAAPSIGLSIADEVGQVGPAGGDSDSDGAQQRPSLSDGDGPGNRAIPLRPCGCCVAVTAR